MSGKDSPQNVIRKFEKRQKTMPLFLGGMAGVLVIVGIIIIIMVVSGKGSLFANLGATKTPTITVTTTPTATQPSATPSMTPTITETPTMEATMTPSAAYQYIVLEGESCYSIAQSRDADLAYMQLINNKDSNCLISPGETIWVPAPGQKIPTPTRVPSDVARATSFDYTIQEGDTLASIAEYFNSTVKDILDHNPSIEDENSINPGELIKVRANLVTPTPTLRPSSTLVNPVAVTATPTVTITP